MLEFSLLFAVIVVALVFDFTTGAHDCSSAIATVVSTKVMSPRNAVMMAAGLNLFGALLGEDVAHTLGSDIVNTDMVMGCQPLVLAALIGAIAWNLITRYSGIPSSSAHALTGGLMGAAISTTRTISARVFGVGATKRLSAVCGGIAGNLIVAWILTIPASAFIAGLSFFVFKLMGLAD